MPPDPSPSTAALLDAAETEGRFATSAAVVRSTRDLVIADGPEAASYLHGQLSQNIEGLDVGRSAWTLLLEPQGRITVWGRITRMAEETFWLDVDSGFGEATIERLSRFKLRTKMTLELRPVVMVAVRGPASPDTEEIRRLLDAGEPDESRGGSLVAALEWPGAHGSDVLTLTSVDNASVDKIVAALGLPEGDPAALHPWRLRMGLPAMGAELGEKTIPAEAGIVDRSADFTKGCYVGQELVARVDSRGNNTPRRVHPVRADGDQLPEPGSVLTIDGDVIGALTSTARSIDGIVGLASIKRGVEVPVVATAVGEDGPIQISVDEVYWV